ncbi:PPOX class F420-dependent oxidoreductase [Streptomyces sp. TRM 70361]|uniref:PPOX class F420-dependent oxidoreductase n=1 Tax=Streptomyces sp. TRM 70361 TaxID=3116553 RepID=UPI002E7AEB47|nr:PPOX class F420-dependent oxidoreductase [Streptomyces sp. TRM 70361]MEE1941657.1 PPOX class F420-dependent oxidoreductase [Streptomyces sp. TRM 70361]
MAGNAGKQAPEELLALLAERDLGVLVTLRRDGRPQLSNVNHTYDPERRLIRISVTADRAKTRNLRRDPRASFHVTSADGWAWTVAEGLAELTPPAAEPGDATVEELIEVYRAIRGEEHPDWDDYRRAVVADRRLVVRLPVDRAYGQPPRRTGA